MIFRNLIFEPEVVKQRLRAGMVSHHEQQASKWNGEQQHRVLWLAYNLNIAPPQASTEGLFQQTEAFTPVILGCPRAEMMCLWHRNSGQLICWWMNELRREFPKRFWHTPSGEMAAPWHIWRSRRE